MQKLIGMRSKKAGLPPGSLVYTGEKTETPVRISVIDYDNEHIEERQAATVSECLPYKDKPSVTWINVDGLHEVKVLEQLGKDYDIHPLVLEDILHVDQRPRIEDMGEYIYIVLKMLYPSEKEDEGVIAEQVSIILGPNFVISFQEQKGDVFNIIRDRIRTNKGRVRKMAADYLAYALIDATVDGYFGVLEGLGEKLEDLEDLIIENPSRTIIQELHQIKREMVYLRRNVWPMREVATNLEHSESKLIKKSTRPYLRDVYEHTVQAIDIIETYRDMASGLQDIYLSSLSNRMNEVMKVLTIIATIFIPLTFIAGVYGMNFHNMPEIASPYGYPAVLAVMFVAAVGMLAYFRKKKWL